MTNTVNQRRSTVSNPEEGACGNATLFINITSARLERREAGGVITDERHLSDTGLASLTED